MLSKPLLHEKMPEMLLHEGIWDGTYRHLDREGQLLDQHKSRVECIFPGEGQFAYIQKNLFTWPDGREHRAELLGKLVEDKLWWDNETFHGYSWVTQDNLILLNLNRKDDPGAQFFEIICLGSDGTSRARTWHWFKNGELFKRTLCDEVLAA